MDDSQRHEPRREARLGPQAQGELLEQRPESGQMHELGDLAVLVQSHTPLVLIESNEEQRSIELLQRVSQRLAARPPVFVWSVTEGLRRLEAGYGVQRHNARPVDVLNHIKACSIPGIFLLLDFHPYLQDPVHVRLLKEIAQNAAGCGQTIVLLSQALELPAELRPLAARFDLSQPDATALAQIVRDRKSVV